MLRLNTGMAQVYRALSTLDFRPGKDAVTISPKMMELASILHAREAAGEETRLRQLHKLSKMNQSEALNTMAALEQIGHVAIEVDHVDAFESRVLLCESARELIQRAIEEKAA